MKQLIRILVFLVTSIQVIFAQNNLFIPFGQTTDDVKTYLESRDYIENVVEDQEMKSLTAQLEENKLVEYLFEGGKLYATTVRRNYSDKKSAKEIQRQALEYLQVTGRGAVKQTTSNNIDCYTTVTDSRVIKLFVIDHKKSITLMLSSFSRQYGPMDDDEDSYYEIELLQNKYISN